jgi:membrane protein implicated in regulation of membrane protease activity
VTERKIAMPALRQVRADRWVKAALILVGVALVLPGFYLALMIAALLADGPPTGAAVWFLLAAFALLAGGIWLVRYARRNY